MASLTGFEVVFYEALGWLNWVALAGGLMICCMNVRVSRHMGWVVAGLVVSSGIGLCYRMLPFLQSRQLLDEDSLSGLIVLGSFGSLVGWCLLFGGLAAVFRDVSDRMRLLEHMADPELPRQS